MLALSVSVYLLLTVFIGYLASRKIKNASDFAVAGRKLPFLMSSAALFATWFGSETILGSTEEFLKEGLIGVIEEPLGAALCLIIVGLFYARRMYRTNAITFSDVFAERFGKKAELMSALVMIPSFFSWIAAQFIALAMLFQVLFGVSFIEGLLIGSVLVVVYTTLGGMWAVSVTDTIQTVVIILGLLFILFLFLWETDINKVIESTPKGYFHLIDTNRVTWIEWFGAWCTVGLGSIASQDIFQRVISSKNEKVAMYSAVSSGILYLVIGIVPLLIVLIGRFLYPTFYHHNQGNFISALIMMKTPVFVQVIYFGALISALLSTASGAILAPATVLAENVIRRFYPNYDLLRIMRWSVVGIAFVSVFISLSNKSIFELAGLASAFSLVSVFIPFTATLFYKGTTSSGVILAMIIGITGWSIAEFFNTEFPSFFIGMGCSIAGLMIGIFYDRTIKIQS